jgi:uncharacterized protein (UPF0332 family)
MDKAEEIERWLQRASESVDEAAYLTANDRSTKTHKGARRAFGVLLIERGAVSAEQAEVYHTLFHERHRADYGYFTDLDSALVLSLIEPVVVLIGAISSAIAQDQ